jgi:osmotically-inducible protein OsmY
MKKNISCAILVAALTALPLGLTTGCVHHHHQRSNDYVNDQTTTARIKSDLLRDPFVKGENVFVSTYKGQVELTGFVDTQEQKYRAGQIAAREPGVAQVHNDLIVRTGR